MKIFNNDKGKCVNSILNEPKGQPVSHLTVSKRLYGKYSNN